MSRTLLLVLGSLLTLIGPLTAAGAGDASGVEFFEKKIRPVLVERCYSCHSATSEKLKGGLRVDSRAGLLRGGSQGAAIRPGDPDGSLLLKAIRYADSELWMPPKGRLPADVDVSVHVRGNPDRFGARAPRGFPRALGGDAIRAPDGSGRLELARWIASPFHPLTARVLVNRIWQHHFGEGLVRSPSNFGTRGEAPSHPDLLDFLARRFLDSGQSFKVLHRFLMTSATYQRSSRASAEALRADPENRLLAWMHRRRLEAESLRDGMLAVAGKLDLRAGGPADKGASFRRMVYLRLSRSERSGFATLFDGANPALHVEQRPVSTIAPQALYLMNASFVLDLAKALAARASGAGGNDPRIDRLYRLAVGRGATDEERALARGFVKSGSPSPWELPAQAVLLSNEFVFVD